MNLGTQTNSLVNHIYSRFTKNASSPEIGMGATILCWTDRRAGTIVAVEKNIISVQEDIATRVDENGMSEIQDYEYARNHEGYIYHFRQDKSGNLIQVQRNEKTGRWNKAYGVGLVIGFRQTYRDYSF